MADSTEEKTAALMDAVRGDRKTREQRISLTFPNGERFEQTYVQKKLSFFGKIDFMELAGRAIEDITNGDKPVSIGKLIEGVDVNDLDSADSFVQLIVRVATHAKTFLKDAYLLALNVPEYDKDTVRTILDMPHDEETGDGGLDDEAGFEILELFVEQNIKALVTLFRERMPALGKAIGEAVDQEQTKESSKRSKRTPQSTPKA